MRWPVAGALAVLVLVAAAGPAAVPAVADTGAAQRAVKQVSDAQARMAADQAEIARLQALAPAATLVDQIRRERQVETRQFDLRQAVRSEQEAIYGMASDSNLEGQVLASLPPQRSAGISDAAEAIRSLWRLSGISNFQQIGVRFSKDYLRSEPVEALRGYYVSAGQSYGIDWTYLGAINYVESDFGRVTGPSGAGAQGPMQFLPSTWAIYGSGDIASEHDSVAAAAHYLAVAGAPDDYGRAILAYNHDANYESAIEHFAAALRTDPRWLTRLYYWSTFG